jgi:hypothetical protein
MVDRPQQHQPNRESDQDDEQSDYRHGGDDQIKHGLLSRDGVNWENQDTALTPGG